MVISMVTWQVVALCPWSAHGLLMAAVPSGEGRSPHRVARYTSNAGYGMAPCDSGSWTNFAVLASVSRWEHSYQGTL